MKRLNMIVLVLIVLSAVSYAQFPNLPIPTNSRTRRGRKILPPKLEDNNGPRRGRKIPPPKLDNNGPRRERRIHPSMPKHHPIRKKNVPRIGLHCRMVYVVMRRQVHGYWGAAYIRYNPHNGKKERVQVWVDEYWHEYRFPINDNYYSYSMHQNFIRFEYGNEYPDNHRRYGGDLK